MAAGVDAVGPIGGAVALVLLYRGVVMPSRTVCNGFDIPWCRRTSTTVCVPPASQ